MKKSKYLLLLLSAFFLLCVHQVNADIIDAFSEKVYHACGTKISTKRLLLSFLKAEASGDDPCNRSMVIRLLSKCKNKTTCEELLAIYRKTKESYGAVIGE